VRTGNLLETLAQVATPASAGAALGLLVAVLGR